MKFKYAINCLISCCIVFLSSSTLVLAETIQEYEIVSESPNIERSALEVEQDLVEDALRFKIDLEQIHNLSIDQIKLILSEGSKWKQVPQITSDKVGENLQVSKLEEDERCLVIDFLETSNLESSFDLQPILSNIEETAPYDHKSLNIYMMNKEKIVDEQMISMEQEVSYNRIVNFRVGRSFYTVNEILQTMDAVPYIEEGRIMIPVKYVLEALEIPMSQANYTNGRLTIIQGSKIIEVNLGSSEMRVNGKPREMTTAPVVKEGRIYIPMSEIAHMLEVKIGWDSQTKIATFSYNK